MDFRAFQLDDAQGIVSAVLAKMPENRVGLLSGDLVMLLPVPSFQPIKRSSVAKRVSKYLRKEIALHLRLVQLLEAAGRFQVGPLGQDVVRFANLRFVEAFVRGGLFEINAAESAGRFSAAATQPANRGGKVCFRSYFLAALREENPKNHAAQCAEPRQPTAGGLRVATDAPRGMYDRKPSRF